VTFLFALDHVSKLEMEEKPDVTPGREGWERVSLDGGEEGLQETREEECR